MNYDIFKDHNVLAISTERIGGMSTGLYTSLNLCDYTGDSPEHVNENRQIFCDKYHIKIENLIFPRQTHTNNVMAIDQTFLAQYIEQRQTILQNVDALVTDIPKICIGINTADCVPIFFYDQLNKTIGLAHAGWRGTVQLIAAKTIEKMSRLYGSQPQNLLVAFGPSISVKNYEIGNECYEAFKQAGFPLDSIFIKNKNSGKYHLDLWKANQWLLNESGILDNQIEISEICSYDNYKNYFSARRIGTQSGRTASCMMLK